MLNLYNRSIDMNDVHYDDLICISDEPDYIYKYNFDESPICYCLDYESRYTAKEFVNLSSISINRRFKKDIINNWNNCECNIVKVRKRNNGKNELICNINPPFTMFKEFNIKGKNDGIYFF